MSKPAAEMLRPAVILYDGGRKENDNSIFPREEVEEGLQ